MWSTSLLAERLTADGLDASRRSPSLQDNVKACHAEHTLQAIGVGVFGVPSGVIDGEVFRDQDRLDVVERCLAG